MLPGPPKSSQTETKMAILAPSWPILGATCCQLGPSCVHLGPIFAPTSPKISTQSSRSAPRHPKTTQGVARGLQDSPWSLNFHGFGVDFGLHLQIYFKGLDALCDPMLNPTSKPQVWHSGGFARAAHWIYPPPPAGVSGVCKSRCPACPISNYKPYLMVPGGPPRALKCPRQPASLPYLIHFFDLSWPS